MILFARPRHSRGIELTISVQITPSQSGNGGGLIMLGRSDGVLNPGGIRFGPTDIYSVLENDEFSKLGIEETLVVGLMVEGGADEKVILFVKVLRLNFPSWTKGNSLRDRCAQGVRWVPIWSRRSRRL